METHIIKQAKQVRAKMDINMKMSQHHNTLFNHGFVAVGRICDVVDKWVMCDGKRVCGVHEVKYGVCFEEVE